MIEVFFKVMMIVGLMTSNVVMIETTDYNSIPKGLYFGDGNVAMIQTYYECESDWSCSEDGSICMDKNFRDEHGRCINQSFTYPITEYEWKFALDMEDGK